MVKEKKTKGIVLIILALAAGLLLLLWPAENDKNSRSSDNGYQSSEEYRKNLENDVRKIVSEVSGVKSCAVMITLKSGFEYYYASNQQSSQSQNGSDNRKEYILAENGNGEQPVLIEERMPVIGGVAVVCPNISAATEYKIILLISALFDIQSNRISVTK